MGEVVDKSFEQIEIASSINTILEVFKKEKINPLPSRIFYVEKGIFGAQSQTGKTVIYINEKGETIFNLVSVRKVFGTVDAFKKAGFIEKQQGDTLTLYKISFDKNGKQILIPIKNDSLEYFNAWKDIMFYGGYQELQKYLDMKKIPMKDMFRFDFMIKTIGVIKPSHYYVFLQSGDLPKVALKSEFQTIYIGKGVLLDQCADSRFDKIGDPVTEQEIDMYFQDKYIDQNLADKCKDIIRERLRTIQHQSLEEKKVIDTLSGDLEKLKKSVK